MWNDRSVSVVLMTYRERQSIRRVIEEFWATGVVDEIVVVNNNAEAGTSAEVAGTGAREIAEPRQGYGHATRRGLLAATGDLVVMVEPDGTFAADDITRLLAQSERSEAVFGTRTAPGHVAPGAAMGRVRRQANRLVARLVAVIGGGPALTDAGCSYRLLSRRLVERIAPHWRVGGHHFAVELTLLVAAAGVVPAEVPVHYLPRVGRSAATGRPLVAIAVAVRMVAFACAFRLRRPALPTDAAGAAGAVPTP